MKKKILIFCSTILFTLFLIQPGTYAQTASVELQDGSGTLISSHVSIQAAWDAIPATVSQAYIIEILSNYTSTMDTYPIILNEKSGASASNWVIIRPDDGATGLVIGADNSGSEIIQIDGADFVTLDGRPGGTGTTPDLTIENSASSGTSTFTIELLNGATNVTLQYLITLNGARDNAGPANIYVHNSSTSTGNVNCTIKYCSITGGRSTIRSNGDSDFPNDNLVIYKNNIVDFGYAAMWLSGNTQNFTIDSNIVVQRTGANSSFAYGLSMGSSSKGRNIITNNQFLDLQSAYTTDPNIRTIYLLCSNDTSTFDIVNNFVALSAQNADAEEVVGLWLGGSGNYEANVYHNSVRLGGVQGTGAGDPGDNASIGINNGRSGANQVTNIFNNIVLNERTGGPAGVFHVGFFNQETTGNLNIDYNVWYGGTGTDSYHAGWGTTYYNDLATYQSAAAPHEQNTLFKSTVFVSSTDLHLSGSSIGDPDLAGTPVGILMDIDGDSRSVTEPYKGADETTAIPVELASFSASVQETSVLISWATATETNNYGFELERAAEDGTYRTLGFVEGNGTSTEIHTYSFVDKNLGSGTYSYRLKQIDVSGSYEYFMLQEEVIVGLPQDYALEQNYPNPFNPTTTIQFSLPYESQVKMVIYDIRGAVIKAFTYDSKPAGFHEVIWNGMNNNNEQVPSGVYIYRFEAVSLTGNGANFNTSSKMTLLK